MAFMRPMSRLLVTISSDAVVETRTAPRRKTSRRTAQTNVEKNIPSDEDVAPEKVMEETSSKTLPKRKMKVVEAMTLVSDMNTSVVLNGRLRRSFEAKL